jgi:hypothetical protein
MALTFVTATRMGSSSAAVKVLPEICSLIEIRQGEGKSKEKRRQSMGSKSGNERGATNYKAGKKASEGKFACAKGQGGRPAHAPVAESF